MALVVETGAGVHNADAYTTRMEVSTYWSKHPHDSLATAWTEASDANKDGAVREATAYLDAVYGPHYRGRRKGRVQGLLWPRTDAFDEDGYDLPDLPKELARAVSELAPRALSSRLAPDSDRNLSIAKEKRKVGPLRRIRPTA